MMHFFFRGFVPSLLLLVACSRVGAESQTHSDSRIHGPSYAAISTSMHTLAEDFSDIVQVKSYGTSVEGRDLNVVKISYDVPNNSQMKRPAVLITGATHGDEYLNIEDRLPRWFAENQTSPGVASFLKAGGVIYIVPIFNPDGYDARQRVNSDGVDLNRDFDVLPLRKLKFNQPETNTFTRYLDEELQNHDLDLKITMDYHCCMGSIVYPWGFSKAPIQKEDLDKHVAIAELMNKIFKKDYKHGATFDLLGYLSEGSSKDYYFAKYGALAFTFEGMVGVEDQNFVGHTKWWDRMLGDLVK